MNRIIHHKQFSSKLYSDTSLTTNMPLSCAAYGCSNHNQREEKTGFYRFPNNSASKHTNKDGTPWNLQGKNIYMCGKHFISGMSSE